MRNGRVRSHINCDPYMTSGAQLHDIWHGFPALTTTPLSSKIVQPTDKIRCPIKSVQTKFQEVLNA